MGFGFTLKDTTVPPQLEEKQRGQFHIAAFISTVTWLFAPVLPTQEGSSHLCEIIGLWSTVAPVWEVPGGQRWSCAGRFGCGPRGHRCMDIRAWTSYQQQSPAAGLIETLCKGQYYRALYHTVIT